jgi:hypothetical protein
VTPLPVEPGMGEEQLTSPKRSTVAIALMVTVVAVVVAAVITATLVADVAVLVVSVAVVATTVTVVTAYQSFTCMTIVLSVEWDPRLEYGKRLWQELYWALR